MNPDSTYKTKLLLQLEYARSGSTVLGEIVNLSGPFLHLGETERLWYPLKNKSSMYPQKACTCKAKLGSLIKWIYLMANWPLYSGNSGFHRREAVFKEDLIWKTAYKSRDEFLIKLLIRLPFPFFKSCN